MFWNFSGACELSSSPAHRCLEQPKVSMETAQRQHPPPGELLGLAQPLQLSGQGARDAPPATAELTFQAWPPQLPERERARQHVGGDCARDRGRVGGRWAPAPPHRPAHSLRFVTPGRAHVPQLRLGAIPRGTHPPCAEDTGLDGKALPEGRPVCVQLAPLPRAGSRPPTSYSGWGGAGGVCVTHSTAGFQDTRPNRARGSGLAWSVWLWGSRKGPTPSIAARQGTQGPASQSRDSRPESGRSKWPVSLGQHGPRAHSQPMQDDSAWLNKPLCFQGSVLPEGRRAAGRGTRRPPSRPRMSFPPLFPKHSN